MSLFKKREKTTPPAAQEAHDASYGTMEDVEAVMKRYDRESNTRIWEGAPKLVICAIMALFAVYCIIDAVFLTTLPERKYAIFMGMILLLGFLTFPVRKGYARVNYIPWYDVVLLIIGPGAYFFYAITAMDVIRLSARIMQDPLYMVIGLIGILALAELCRRCVGLPILCVAGALLIYTFSTGRGLAQVIRTLFYTTNGIFSAPVQVCVKFIAVFIIFGAFLERSGVADFFIKFANCAVGRYSGGPAKVAVIASALEGMASGSSVANTVGSGSITIPMMKRMGYNGEFAGAVEAAASTGGQIMPPIMGAAAFLMAEFTGVPYGEIAVKAILPAILYFTGIYIAVHLEAKKLGLKGIPREELPKARSLIKQIYLLAPLVVLVWLVGSNTRTMAYSAALSIVVAIIVGIISRIVVYVPARREGRKLTVEDDGLTLGKLIGALEGGARGSLTVAVACGMAGIISGCITVTGLASKLLGAIVALSGGQVFVALTLTMLCCIVLGMGVPTTANYCIMASTCAPILVAVGVDTLAAHFFVFYFGIVADITPPVALAAYAGAAIAKANPMKTGLNATKLAIAAFVVPYVFALSPQMLFIDVGSVFQVIQICITAVLGIFGVAVAMNGFIFRPANPVIRLLFLAGGLCMLIPESISDVVGILLVAALCVYQYLSAKRSGTAAA